MWPALVEACAQRCLSVLREVWKKNFNNYRYDCCLCFTAATYTQAYNQAVLANQQQQQAAQLLASANTAVAATSGIAGLGLLGLATQKEGECFNVLPLFT